MDSGTRRHIGQMADLMGRTRQVKHVEHSLLGGYCTLGAAKKTDRARTKKTMSVLDDICSRKWGMGAVGANDSGLLKPRHLRNIAGGANNGSGVKHKKAQDDAAKKKQAAQDKATKAPGTGPSKKGVSGARGPCLVAATVAVVWSVVAFWSMIAAVFFWTGIAIAVILALVVARWAVWSFVPTPNWAYLGIWLARRREVTAAVEQRREQWERRIEADSAPIALGPVQPAGDPIPDWVTVPDKEYVRR